MRIGTALLAGVLIVPAAPGEMTRVSFPTADGGIVHALTAGDGKHAVVLAHGGRFTKESWQKQIPGFLHAGFRVLAIDFRGRGDSRGGPQEDSKDDVHLDVLAAVRYLRRTGAHRVSVVGASFGGAAAARAAVVAEEGEIDDLVLLAASSIDDPERMQGRKLFITARDDFRGEGEPRLPDIRDQYERAPGPKELVILEGSAHAQYLFDTEQADRLLREILDFLGDPKVTRALEPLVPARVLDQDPLHRQRGRRVELRLARPDGRVVLRQPQVGLVDQCGRLQAVPGAFVVQTLLGDPAKLVVHGRQQPAGIPRPRA